MSLKIEKISNKHTRYIFNLRNERNVREFSKNKKIIKFQDHLEWLKKFKKNKNNKFFIFLSKNNSKMGYVRFKIQGKSAYVSIAITKKFRGMGFSKNMLLAAEKKMKVKNFIAVVNKKNLSSISLFHSLNYYKFKNQGDFILMKKNKSIKVHKKYISIINKIEKIRKKNNSNWMDLLRIAFKYSPKEAAKIMSNIYKHDNKISLLSKKLSK
tara:strand:+ start:1913 stop:2545 length:633 start_codon:yes stop_codon:yes gene_type:complete